MFDKHKKTGLNNGKRSEIKKAIDEVFLGVHQPEKIFAMNLAFFVSQTGGNKKYYTRSEIKTVIGFEDGIDSEWRLNILVNAFFIEVPYKIAKIFAHQYPLKDGEKLYRIKSNNEIGQMAMDMLEKYLDFKRNEGEDFGQYMLRLICEYYRLKPFELITEVFRQLLKHPVTQLFRKHFDALPEEERLPELQRLLKYNLVPP